jgi:hypothetical protein
MKLVWKANTKVGIMYQHLDLSKAAKYVDDEADQKMSYAIYWLCPGVPITSKDASTGTVVNDFKTHRTVVNAVNTPNNVGEACLKTDNSNNYNDCFNQVQLKKTNEIRYQHLADAAKIDTKFAGLL